MPVKPAGLGEEAPVDSLSGIGPARRRLLAEAGLKTVGHLLWYLPFRYEDRRNPTPISALKADSSALLLVEIKAVRGRRARRAGLRVTEAIVSDGTGNLHVIWFNQPYMEKLLGLGAKAYLYGRTGLFSTRAGLRLQMENPEVELAAEGAAGPVHSDRIVPVYRRCGELSGRVLRNILDDALKAARVDEVLPSSLLVQEGLADRGKAFAESHFPPEDASLEALGAAATPAQRRLVFEEFLEGQLLSALSRKRRAAEAGAEIVPGEGARELLKSILPFPLTTAQRRAFREIVKDLRGEAPMYRLLQGDVGSGKTIVAFLAMFLAAREGWQAAFVAPTEILARQQFERLSELAAGTGLRAAYLTAAVAGKPRAATLRALATGEAQMVVGTHSLFQEGVAFKRLGLAVVDEQHRFGVEQRARLAGKGASPNVLVMSATPIPRSLALTLFGDMDLSVLDERPAGRKGVATAVRGEEARHRVEAFLRSEMDRGRHVFAVFPLVEESEESQLRAAIQAYERYSRGPFRGYPLALLHGRMKAAEKQAAMESLRSGKVKMLVTTSVVEVGVDLPEATVMVVEHAERFGLAQLHQMRGRVGRGAEKGYCALMVSPAAPPGSLDRLRVLERTQDGFEIAEEDLRLRGPGDPGGVRQWGGGAFRIARPLRDSAILDRARHWAGHLVAGKVPATDAEAERFKEWLARLEKRRGEFSGIG